MIPFTTPLRHVLLATMLVAVCLAGTAPAQTTAFSYQGKLTEAGNPANGNYDLQFILYDALIGGAQQGPILTRNPVAVSAGIFNVTLDFGANVFMGGDRFLEIGVRPAGSANPYTILVPRQAILSSPYAIQTLNAQQLGGVPASRYLKADTDGNVGIGIAMALAKMHIVSGANDLPPRLQSSGTTGAAAGWDFFHGTTAKAYVGVPDASAAQAPGELTLFGGTGVKTSLWAGGIRAMTLDTNGKVGIGTTNPASKVEIAGAQDALRVSGFQPFITLQDTNAPGGLRGVIQSADGHLGFVPHSFIGTGNSAMIIRNTTGNVGIGTADPATKFQIVAGNMPGIHVSTNQGNAILAYATSPTFASIYGENLAPNSFGVYGAGGNSGTGVYGGGLRGVQGTSNFTGGVGVYGISTSNSGTGVYGENSTGYAMVANGHAAQALDKGGWVKAMLLVKADGSINLCYNPYLTGSAATTAPCGFTVNKALEGMYFITFPFQVQSRFFSATPVESGDYGCSANVWVSGAQTVRVFISVSGGVIDSDFYLIVF